MTQVAMEERIEMGEDHSSASVWPFGKMDGPVRVSKDWKMQGGSAVHGPAVIGFPAYASLTPDELTKFEAGLSRAREIAREFDAAYPAGTVVSINGKAQTRALNAEV